MVTDGLPALHAALLKLRGDQVLVGIPEADTQRFTGQGKNKVPTPGVNNAQLLFIHSNGSPSRGIPRRMVIEPALNAPDNKDRYSVFLKRAILQELDGNHPAAIQSLKLAGVSGERAARAWFTDPRNGWPPDKIATVNRKLGKMSKKKREAAIDAIVAAGGDLTGIVTTLIDTAQMRRAITSVVIE